MLTVIGITLATLLLLIFLWNRHNFSYWQRRGVPYIPSKPLVGNILDLLLYRCNFGELFKKLYDHEAARNQPYVGIHVLHNHALLLRDPELIKRILNKDFSSFSNRFETTDAAHDFMGSLNLFFAKYNVWKDIHKMFTPLFASGKVRQMYPLLLKLGKQLEDHIAQLPFDADTNATEIEVRQMSMLITLDMIASLAFGVDAKCLQNSKSEFYQLIIEVNDPRPLRIVDLFVMFFFPQLAERFRTRLFSDKYEAFMRNSLQFVMDSRKRSGMQRHDLIDIFLQLKRTEGLNPESVVNKPDFFEAQAGFLLLAGSDTSSATINFALYELAKQAELQQRLRAEIAVALRQQKGELSYEALNELQYLRQVVDEVLRLHPPTAFLDRTCTAEQTYSLEPYGTFKLPQGMPIYIPTLGLHRDEKLWPNPLKFDPERFAPENRKLHVPNSYLPFGSGPRACIGSVLALVQVKNGLVHILKNYRVEPCSRTVMEMEYDEKAFVLNPKNGNYLSFVKDKLLDT